MPRNACHRSAETGGSLSFRALAAATAPNFCRLLFASSVTCELKTCRMLATSCDALVSQTLSCLPVPRSLRLAKHALLFCQAVWPRLRHHLPESWAAIRTLQDLRPRGVRTPVPLPLVLSMIIAARARALPVVGVSRETWLLFAYLLEVGFFALLRPGELLNLKACDVGTLNSLSLGLPHCTLRISCPKNRRSMGPEQFVVLTHPCACMWLTYFAGLRRPHECLWLASAQEVRSRFHSVCRCLGLLHCRLTPASLRAGGASYFYLSGMPISSLKFMGRWTSEATLAHYIQFATAQQVLLRLSDRTSRNLRLLLLQGFFLLEPSAVVKQTLHRYQHVHTPRYNTRQGDVTLFYLLE